MIGAPTAGEAIVRASARLAAAGIAESRREARLLLALSLALPSASLPLLPEREIAPAAAARFESLLERRLRREPYSRIAGKREFWSLDFALSPDTFDPRPDSETLIETALAHIPERGRPLEILDLGTGTGALLLALLSELPNATGIGVDILPSAVAQARRNAATLGLSDRARFISSDWGAALDRQVDLLLANPPYIQSGDIPSLAPEVADFDPPQALDGGADGLAAYRAIAGQIGRLLRPAGIAVFEIGAGQAAEVEAIMTAAGWERIDVRADLAGIARCLAFVTRKKDGKWFK